MRIGLIIYGSLETLSGGFLYDRKLVEALAAAGHEVEVLTLPWRNYAVHLTDNLSADLRKRLEGARYDLLLQDELNHPSLFWLNRQLKKRVAYPIAAIVHHLRSVESEAGLLRGLYRTIERQYLRTIDGFIFNSETTRRTVEALIGPVAQGVVARPAGDRFRDIQGQLAEREPPAGRLRLLFVGNVIPRKGLHILLQALERLDFADWTLDVVGSLQMAPAYARALVLHVERVGLLNRVTFWGALDRESLAVRYATSDLLVVPSSYEGFGIVYLEAMGFGLPPIAARAGAAGELIRDGENGLLLPPGDPVALARCLTMLHRDRDLLAEMGVQARARFAQHPTWEESMGVAVEFLEGLEGLKKGMGNGEWGTAGGS